MRATLEECQDLAAVRRNIDRIDREVVALLVERGAYVLQAARFKSDDLAVRAPERAAHVIDSARRQAAELGGSPEVIGRIYRGVVEAFTEAELTAHGSLRPGKA